MQIITPEMAARPWMASLLRWTGQSKETILPDRATTLAAMDASGVGLALLSAWTGPEGVLISNEAVANHVQAAPDRFRGVMSVDLRNAMSAVRSIRRGARQGFVGVRVLPWLWDLPPNDRRYYPIYAACVDEGLPFCTQIGHTGPLQPSDPGRLIPYLEDVLLDFPELVVVGGHVGFPWVDEVISIARKFPNFYVDTSAYALHRLPGDFVDFLKADGRARIMFGTNWPMLSPARCLKGLDELGLERETRDAFLGATARRVFNIN
ncbi:MAG: amidohydrolase family protein [Alphaproteobacteria bacterium]|nr:amidohydrolase family protein [Alphaproteobacteria bacterium]